MKNNGKDIKILRKTEISSLHSLKEINRTERTRFQILFKSEVVVIDSKTVAETRSCLAGEQEIVQTERKN